MRVYERSVSPVLYVEWHWLGERHQRSLKTTTGHPVTDKRLAMRIAHEISRKLEDDHNAAAREAVFGATEVRTLPELLAAYQNAKGADERFQRFWLRRLGTVPLAQVTPALVERTAAGNGWSPKTEGDYLRFMVAAFDYAEHKLKWITAAENLSAVDIPKPEGRSKSYTLDEVRRLLPALEAVDPRAGWIGHVAWQTGRRLQAIRTLKKAAVEVMDGYSVLTFPSDTDKARKSGKAVVVGVAHELTAHFMAQPGRYVIGAPRKELCLKGWLPRAEKDAGIEHVRGRGFHGFKRRYATEARHIEGFDKQAGTTKDTLERRYVQDDKLDEKLAVADALASLVGR